MLCFIPFSIYLVSLSLFFPPTFAALMLLKLLMLHQHQTGVSEIRISFNVLQHSLAKAYSFSRLQNGKFSSGRQIKYHFLFSIVIIAKGRWADFEPWLVDVHDDLQKGFLEIESETSTCTWECLGTCISKTLMYVSVMKILIKNAASLSMNTLSFSVWKVLCVLQHLPGPDRQSPWRVCLADLLLIINN